MKIIKIPFHDIVYRQSEFDETLKNSILRISLSFPIQVRYTEGKYICMDGNKRMSAIAAILQEQPDCKKFDFLSAIEIHDARTDNGWSRKRYH